jgi:hypothetical protein
MVRDVEYVAFVEAKCERHLRLTRLPNRNRNRGEELLQDRLVRLYARCRRAAITGHRRLLAADAVNGNISWVHAWRSSDAHAASRTLDGRRVR